MSSSNYGATKWTPDSGSGALPRRSKRLRTGATSQPTAVDLFEVKGRGSTNEDEDGQFDKLREEDELHLTNIQKFFPELVWRKVLGKLEDKTDIENCSNASPFFGYLLREKRETKVVLPSVFEILANRYCDEKNKDESYVETNVESIPWQRSERMKEPHRMTGIWKLRLVCKKWNLAIEEIHQNEAAGHFKMDGFSRGSGASELATDIFFQNSQVDRFLGKFEPTHFDVVRQVSKKNPFLGRNVRVQYYNDLQVENNHAYFNKLLELFQKFGDQVYFFKFSWARRDSVNEFVYVYLKLKQIVELMPNLKVLRISCCGAALNEDLVPLEAEIERSPFPELTYLEMMSVDAIPAVLCNHLVRQNRQISRLEIGMVQFNGNCTVFAEHLPNLRQLSLEEVYSRGCFDVFESSPSKLNLEKFQFGCSTRFQFLPWARLFNAVGSQLNSDLCTDLVLRMPMPKSDAQRLSVLQDSQQCRLQLANIQRCQVNCSAHFFLDFLLPSKNTLREIKIDITRHPGFKIAEQMELVDKQVIKFLGCEDHMERSNIGKELLSLRKLKVISNSHRHLLRLIRHYNIQPNGVVEVEKEERW